mgnify:FL=1
MRWILASASPRRRELLRQIELPFEVSPSEADENIERETPELLVEELSRRKCAEVGNRIGGECLVLGADTVVALGDQVLGKPGTEERAAEMLRMLSGKAHKVCTGVTLGEFREGKLQRQTTFSEVTEVFLYPLSEGEIREYIASGEPMDKAGAYGIQGRFAKFVKKIHGDYNNVVGLPAARVYQEIKKLGLLEQMPGTECPKNGRTDQRR